MKIVKIKYLEVWKPLIINNEITNYIISNKGRVKNVKTNKILKLNSDGHYLQVAIFHKGKRYMKKIHRLVAEAFIKNYNNYKCVNHKNGNKTFNYALNLEWVTYSENNIHAYRKKLKSVVKVIIFQKLIIIP